MTERRLELVDLATVTGAPRNPKRHAAAELGASIGRFGYVEPMVIDERTGRLVAGHGRLEDLLARQAAGEEPPAGVEATNGSWLVPVLRGWSSRSDAEAEAYLVASNRIGEVGGWDSSALAELLGELAEAGPEALVGTGYDADAVAKLLADLDAAVPPAALSDPDAVPEAPAEPVTRPGDLWLCGDHRVYCGDATDPAAYEVLLAGESAALCLTDPPYGVGIDYGSGVSDDEATIGALIGAFMPLALTHAKRTLVTSGNTLIWLYPRPSWVLAWVEPAGIGVGPWGFTCTNLVLAYGTDPYLAAGRGSRPDTLVGRGEGASSPEHPVAKPIGVWRWLMERGSVARGDLVVDPFAGSGTTLIAAHALGRRAACIELSPAYVDVICRRYQEHVGALPVLERTGEAVDFGGVT